MEVKINKEILMPKRLLFSPDNLYYEALKETIQDHEREAMGIRKKRKAQTKNSKSREVNADENFKDAVQAGQGKIYRF